MGREQAAARIQSLFRMNHMRLIYERVWDAVAAAEKLAADAADVRRAEAEQRERENAERKRVEEESLVRNKLDGNVTLVQSKAEDPLEAALRRHLRRPLMSNTGEHDDDSMPSSPSSSVCASISLSSSVLQPGKTFYNCDINFHFSEAVSLFIVFKI